MKTTKVQQLLKHSSYRTYATILCKGAFRSSLVELELFIYLTFTRSSDKNHKAHSWGQLLLLSIVLSMLVIYTTRLHYCNLSIIHAKLCADISA